MIQTVCVDEAQNKLQDLLADALAGDEVIITERGTPDGAPSSGCGSV
jgi:prevent-host-death family protein